MAEKRMEELVAIMEDGELVGLGVKDYRTHSIVDVTDLLAELLARSLKATGNGDSNG